MTYRPLARFVPLAALLFAACNTSDQASPESVVDDPYRLVSSVAPVAQELSLRIDPDQERFSGSTTITIEVSSPAAEIRLHAEDIYIESLALWTGGAGLDVTHATGEHGLLSVTSVDVFPAGTYKLRINFSNDFNTDGESINRTENEGRHYIFSQFEADLARKAFPCFDEPGFKFPWQLTIAVPEDVMAITNTPEESVTTEDGWTTTVFAATPALPSYLIAVAVGPFETVPIDGMSIPGRVIVPEGNSDLAAFAVETTPPLLAYLEDYFGEPYPFKKLDLIATYQAFSGAMEHPGAITYSDFYLLLDENASPQQRSMLIKITAHELAHQWFGNLVTMKWWDDLWLNESFADWMGDKTVDAVYPEYGRQTGELRTTFRIMDTDARPTTKAIRHDFKSTDNFSDGVFLSYYKGKAVLGMFEKSVGTDVFRDGVVRYLRKYSRGNAEASDLWAQINAGAEFDLAGGLESFIDQPGIPLISVEALGDGRYEFSQSRLVTGADVSLQDQSWIIPVSYRYLSGDVVVTAETVLSEKTQLVDLGAEASWILPNANQDGYYRWNIPADMLSRLGDDAASSLNVRERMGMLTNLWALLATDKIDAADFLAALKGMSSDTDPSVISAILDQLGSINETFITPELRDEYATFIRALLEPTLDRIGTEALPDDSPETATLRPQVLLWLADYGRDDAARAVTASLLERYLAGEIPLTGQVSVAMRVEARRGDQALFDTLRERFEAETSPNVRRAYIQAIGSFRDPAIVEQVLDYLLAGPFRPGDIGTAFFRLAGWADNNALLLEWLMAKDAVLRERLPPGGMARIPDAMTVCSPDNLSTIKEFYGAPERATPGIENELIDSEAEVMECWEFRQRELDSVTDYLQGTM